jgi:L-threonylcarbamoyladenylate synthase
MPYVSLAAFLEAGRSGQLISFPTDTVPALAAHPDHAHQIYEAKQRQFDKPLILMGATAQDLWPYTEGSLEEQRIWQAIAQQYWPGAVTLVLPASDRLPPQMNPTGSQTIGLRIPNHAIARQILAQTGPLATTSVNRSGQPPLQSHTAIAADFPQVYLLAVEAQAALEQTLQPASPASPEALQPPTTAGTPSTVVQWTPTGWQVLRQGSITFSATE